MKIFNRLFCKHNNKGAIYKYYYHYPCDLFSTGDYQLNAYKVYLCADCGKPVSVCVFNKMFITTAQLEMQCRWLEKRGYVWIEECVSQ